MGQRSLVLGRSPSPVLPAPTSLPTHQSLFPGAFSSPPGRQGCSTPALLRHEPLALRSGAGGKWRETNEKFRACTRGPEPQLPRTWSGLMKAPACGPRVQPSGLRGAGAAGQRAGAQSPSRAAGRGGAAPARGEAATQSRGLAPRATALSGLRLRSSHRG